MRGVAAYGWIFGLAALICGCGPGTLAVPSSTSKPASPTAAWPRPVVTTVSSPTVIAPTILTTTSLLPSLAGIQAASGDRVVVSALAAVAQTTRLPLLGPANLETAASGRYLGAYTEATATSYDVHLRWSTTPLAVNSPALLRPPNAGVAYDLGSFGGSAYSSTNEARSALQQMWVAAGFSAPGSSVAAVQLTPTVSAQLWTPSNASAPTQVVRWQQNGWHWVLRGQSATTPARAMASYIQAHSLPRGPGIGIIEDTAEGRDTTLYWEVGADLYHADNYHHAVAGVQDAEAMTSYEALSRALLPETPLHSLTQDLVRVQSLNALNPWVTLQSPTPGASVVPGQWLPVVGHVNSSGNWGKSVGVALLAGDEKPSQTIAESTLYIDAQGNLEGAVRIPYSLPAVNGTALTLVLEPGVRGGPLVQVLLVANPSTSP